MSLTQTPSSEDCLNLDVCHPLLDIYQSTRTILGSDCCSVTQVKKPAGLPQDAKLPVLFWIRE